MPNETIYLKDVENRFPSYVVNKTTNGSITRFELDDDGTLISYAESPDAGAAIFELRKKVVGDMDVLPLLTETQRNALTGEIDGENILNSNTTHTERFHSSSWTPGNQVLNGNFTFQGSTKFGGSETISPNGAIDIVGTDAATARIRTMRFQASANGAGAIQVGHSRGTEGTASALLSGDRIGQFLFVGDDGTTQNGAGPVMRSFTTENWGSSAKGSKITFETIKNGATAETLGLTISEHGYPEVPSYVVASLPNVGGGTGIIYVSDETGGATLAFSDGTNWRRVQDRAIVA